MPQAAPLVSDFTILGNYGELHDDGGFIANINKVEAKVTVAKLDVNRSGTRVTGYKRGAITGEGTMTGFKVTSRWVELGINEMSDETNPPTPISLVVRLDDPEALGTEEITIGFVKFWEFPFGYNVGDLIMEELPFTFESIELTTPLTGDFTTP